MFCVSWQMQLSKKPVDALMTLKDFVVTFLIAFVLTGLFVVATRRRGRRGGFFPLFLILFGAAWAGNLWLRPFGPAYAGLKWLQMLVIGAILIMLLAVLFPRRAPRGRHETLEQLEEIGRARELEHVTYVTLGTLFWVVLAFLIMAVIARLVIGY
jgi:hypothetical protein